MEDCVCQQWRITDTRNQCFDSDTCIHTYVEYKDVNAIIEADSLQFPGEN